MQRRTRTIAVALLATLAAAACGSDDGPETTGPSTTGATSSPTTVETAGLPALGTDPDAAFVVIDGGVPAISADGRVFTRTADAQGFAAVAPPVRAIGALTMSQLTPAGLAAVVAAADELDLLADPPDYGDVGITDQGSFHVTLTTAEGTYEHSVYAPGYETGDADADAARQRLAEFVGFVGALHTRLGGEISDPEPYVPERWIVDTSPYVSTSGAQPWPFETEPVDGCVSLASAPDADTVSGVYTVPATGDAAASVVEVIPSLPWDTC